MKTLIEKLKSQISDCHYYGENIDDIETALNTLNKLELKNEESIKTIKRQVEDLLNESKRNNILGGVIAVCANEIKTELAKNDYQENTKSSQFTVKIDDGYCEWEYGFSLDGCINDFVKAIESKMNIKKNYIKNTRQSL